MTRSARSWPGRWWRSWPSCRSPRYEHRALLDRAFQLRADVTMYDAVYLGLAEVLDAPLLTADAALGEVPGSTAVVDVRLTA